MNVSIKAVETINLVKNAVSKSITGVSFFSIKNYTNKNGETSNQLINVGINYDKAKAQDLIFLENLNLSKNDLDLKSNISDLEAAKAELIASFIKPNENRSNGQINAYTNLFSGVKVHNESGQLYIFGFRQNKTVLVEGVYPKVNSSAKTLAKKELQKHLKTNKFVNFAIEVGNTLKANGETIEI